MNKNLTHHRKKALAAVAALVVCAAVALTGGAELSLRFSSDEDGNATSSVLKITADGRDIEQVGNTMIFAETGLEEVEGYTLPRDIQTTGGTVNLVDRAINDVKSKIGKSRVVVVSSQLGVPIAVYQGNSVGYEIPEDLPKFTKLTIDGKALYIHRANYLIIDKDAL